MWYIYKMEYYSAIKGWNNAISNNMNGPRDCHTEWSKSEKETYHILSLICGLKKKKSYKWTYLQNRNKVTGVENWDG